MAILLGLIFSIFSAKYDAIQIAKENYIMDHTSRVVFRTIVTLFIVYFFDLVSGLIFGLTFWIAFDHVLNYFRGLHWLYLGSVANTDLFFKKSMFLFIGLKSIAIIIITYLTFYK